MRVLTKLPEYIVREEFRPFCGANPKAKECRIGIGSAFFLIEKITAVCASGRAIFSGRPSLREGTEQMADPGDDAKLWRV